jgi:Family of unknown function (DUF6492)
LKDIVLYCKSYRSDFLRLSKLLSSIENFNVDKIDFWISTPKADYELLVEVLGRAGYCWIADEDIVRANSKADFSKYFSMPGRLSQQVIKAEFWRTKIAENYLCIDSDSIFIRNFYKSDFLAPDSYPYTVLHQNKEYFQLAVDRGRMKIQKNLTDEALRVKAFFKRLGPTYFFAPAPFIWSSKVWRSLDDMYLTPHEISIWDFIKPDFPETMIYGETLLKFQAIPILPIEPLFRVYHYDWHYYLMKRFGETEEKVQQNYLGVIYQSNWDSSINFGVKNKPFFSRVIKQLKRIAKYLESFI